MKKTISIIIAFVLALLMTTVAFADTGDSVDIYGGYYDYADMYGFDEKEVNKLKNTAAEALEKANGYAGFFQLVKTLEENGIYVTDWKVIKEKTANYVFDVSVIDSRNGNTWRGIYAVYTHWGSEKVLNALIDGRKVPFLAVFLTQYVENQKINDYPDNERITSKETNVVDAVNEFIDFMNHYAERYDFYYGDSYWSDDYWSEDWEDEGNG